MGNKAKVLIIKYSSTIAITLMLLVGVIGAVVADYTGPDRTITTYTTVWERRKCVTLAGCDPAGAGYFSCTMTVYTTPTGTCTVAEDGYFTASACSWPYPLSSCPGSTSKSLSGNSIVSCTEGQTACTDRKVPHTTTLDPATVSGSVNCETSGLNGWCIAGATLTLTAKEPVSGWSITGIESTTGMLCNSASCTFAFDQGVTNLTYWAESSHGDTSYSKTATMSFDSVPPTVDAMIIEGTGTAPWYRSAVTLAASGSDASSGVDSINVVVDGSSQANPYTITTEGSYSAYGQVTDAAGNTAYTSTTTINIDLTPPTSSLTSSGETIGDNGWLIAPLALTASGSDGLSGVGSENVIVNGGAQGSTTTLDTEGSFTVYAQVIDTAGNTSDSVSTTYNLDLNPPAVAINPVDGMSLLPMYGKHAMPSGGFLALTGRFTLSGMVSDTISGINTAEYSVDGGSSWISLPVEIDGSYSVVVDTAKLPGGTTTFTVRAFDQAGLSGSSSISGIVANAGPKVTLTNTWFLSQSGALTVKSGDTAISRVTISICDPSDSSVCVTETYASNSIPSLISWNGLFGSQAAAAGPYLVIVTARDTAGKSDSATGTIVIPVTPTPTVAPSRSRQVAEVINTPIPTPAPTTVVAIEELPDEAPKAKQIVRFKMAPYFILLLFVGLFAFISMADPRPRQWQRVAKAVQKMNEINRK